GYLFAMAAAFLLQRSLLYFPTQVDEKGVGRGEFQPLIADGGFVGYVRAATGSVRRVVVFFHGNGGEALDRGWIDQIVPTSDVTLILAEYPGYGARPGSPSEKANVQAARDLVRFAREKWQ